LGCAKGTKGILKTRIANPERSCRNAVRTFVAMASALLAMCEFSNPTRAATLYWDTDGSTAGNNASTGANIGGSGVWNSSDFNWWDASLGSLQVWTNGGDAVFWGTAGAVTVSTVSPNSISLKASSYSLNSGTLTMIGAATFNVDTGITATVSSTIAGTNTLVKLGAGTLIVSNTNNINTATSAAGGWRIEGGGVLRIMGDGSLGAPLPDIARNTVTDIQLNQSTLQAGASFVVSQNRRTKINTNASTNRGDAIIDVNGHVLAWFGSLQGGAGSLRVISRDGNGGMLILGTDKVASVNPFGSVLPAGATNLTVQDGVVVQTSGQVTPTGGELGSETNTSGAVLAIKLEGGGQIRSESGDYTFFRNLVLGPGGGSLDVGAWIQTFAGGTVSGPGSLTKWGTSTLVLDNSSATWMGGTSVRQGTLQLGRGGSYGLLPGTLANPSSVVISSGAMLKFSRGSDKSFFDIISGAGGINVANTPTATVRLVSDNTYTGPTTISSGTLMIGQGNAGQQGSIASSVVNNSGTLVFNRVEDLAYAGAIGGAGAMTKQATGTLVLSGTHTYTGATTVRAGTLLVNGVIGASAVTLTNGTLGGTGIIKGPVIVQWNGRLAPGGSVGTLTISNSLSLSGFTVMELNAAAATNDVVRGLSGVTYGGTLLLSNVAGTVTASNVFKLFSANSYSGAFAALVPASPGPGLAWNTKTLAMDGTLRVVSTNSAAISSMVSGSSLALSLPSDHIGWRLQVQTNSILVGISTNWFDVLNSTRTNGMTFTLDGIADCVFYRLRWP
jgi:autotransporter-associated beta strand protein